MTTTSPNTPAAANAEAASRPLEASDPRSLFAGAVRLGGQVVAQVRPQHFTLPTPCTQMDVHHLLGHLVAVLQRVAHVGTGGSVVDIPEVAEGVADDGWADAWAQAAHGIREVWSDDALLTRTFVLPWAQIPGSAILAMYANEVTVHTWDLARAVGVQPQWDDAVITFAFDLMRHVLPAEGRTASFEAAAANLPEDMRAFDPPFAEAITVQPDAPAIDQLVAWNGRQP